MLKSERAKFIMDFLEQTYPNTPVPLNNKNVFELLVAVLLSAQCTDERVNKVTQPKVIKVAEVTATPENNSLDLQKLFKDYPRDGFALALLPLLLLEALTKEGLKLAGVNL